MTGRPICLFGQLHDAIHATQTQRSLRVPGVAESAELRATAHDLDRDAVVSRFGPGDQRARGEWGVLKIRGVAALDPGRQRPHAAAIAGTLDTSFQYWNTFTPRADED